METPPTIATPPSAPPQPPGFPWAMFIVIVAVGFFGILTIGGAAAYFYFASTTHQEVKSPQSEVSPAPAPSPEPAPAPLPAFSAPVPAPAILPPEAGPSVPSEVVEPAVPAPNPEPEPVAGPPQIPPAAPGKPSILGVAGTVDVLDVPVALPKGVLSFIRGLDLLGANRPAEAIPFFSQAIAANEENSDYYTARGSASVVAEKMQDGLPDLQRALTLNPKNILASRMTRLAYLMLGDQLKASKFYGHGSTQNVDFLITEVGVGYGSRTTALQRGYKQDIRDQQKTAAALQKLPTVASMVAAAYRSGDQNSVQALFAMGVDQIKAGDYVAAQRSFRDVLAKYPYDWTSHYYHARSVLEVGDPELARRELTYVLCWKRFLPEAFAARALCAARQSDAKRAKADLDIAMKLDPAKAAEAQAAVAQIQQKAAPAAAGNEGALWDALGTSAKASAAFDEIAATAVALRQNVNARRLRWDEIYEGKLHELCEAVRAQPGNVDRLADVAEFLDDNKEVRGLQVEPNGSARYFRVQTTDTLKWEIETAYTLVNEGLSAQPNHARCLALRSRLLLHAYNNCEEAEKSAQAAIRSNPKLIEGHMALSNCYKEYARRWREKAAAFRTPKTGTRTVHVVDQNGRFIRDDTETYSIPPSAEDLAKAAECDRHAEANEKAEQECLNNALACAKGTPKESFYQALMCYLRKDYACARPWLEKAVRDNPNDPKMRHGLANCLWSLGLEDEYIEEFGRAINLQETTAEVWLKVAWTKIERTAWDGARKALLRARELDPADARIWAYAGIVSEFSNKDAAESNAGLRAALAQEEARARLNGTTYLANAAGGGMLSPEDLGLSMMLRLKLARFAFKAQPAVAADYYLATAASEKRMSEWNLAGSVHSAVLPLPGRDPRQQAGSPPLVGVLKNNRIFAGQALLNLGRSGEAAAQFAQAENFANLLPAGGTIYLEYELEPQYVPFRVSSMPIYVKALNAATLLQQGKKEEARLELTQVRFYLANRSQEQRAMQDDPIPALYAKLAPSVGLQ